jgi:hypothetical protein
MKQTFASRVRAAAKALHERDGQVGMKALAAALGDIVQTRAAKKLLGNTVLDFVNAGEMRRASRGVYAYQGKRGSTQKQQIMWRYLRSGRTFGGVTVEELQEVAGASYQYVMEWLQILTQRGIAKQIKGRGDSSDGAKPPDRWQLVCDPLDMPSMDESSERNRAAYARRRAKILDALAKAKAAIEAAEEFISRGDAEDAEGAKK